MNTADTKYPTVEQERIKAPLLMLSILFIVALGISVIPASWLGIKQEGRQYAPLNLGSISQAENLATDADNNGVISWKEFVSSSLDVGPDQAPQLISDIESDSRTIAALNDQNNLTSSFTKNLYIASTALKQSGISDTQSEQQVINQLIQQEARRITVPTYTKGNIVISSDVSTAALKKYGNTMADILKDLITEKTIIEDLGSITTFIESEDEGDLLPLLKNTNTIQQTVEKLLAVKVPENATAVHLEILNAFGSFANTLHNMASAYDDPVRATFAVKEYSDDAVEALRGFPKLSTFFARNNVTFTAQESGYVFAVGYTAE